MVRKLFAVAGIALFAMLVSVCGKQQTKVTELKNLPMDNLDGLISLTGVEIDKSVSSDGSGSLKINATEPMTVNLYEINDVEIENARLIYQARVRCENLGGKAYLEMWCHFPGKGDFFSRGLQAPISGTMNWTTVETPFFLKTGEKPNIIKLNLVVDGKGTAWIDDIKLLKAPL